MINSEEVKKCLKSISGLNDDELEENDALVRDAVSYAESIIKSCPEGDNSKVVFLAAARAAYLIALSGERGVTDFKAGDVSFSVNSGSALAAAKELYENALEACADLTGGKGFVFRTV